jgi:uroporphyrinogen-III synthase
MSAAMTLDPSAQSTPAGLDGARVALLEGRMGQELADLVRRHHGVPQVAPAVREVPLDASEAVGILIDHLTSGRIDMVVMLTGAGAEALFSGAERMGRLRELEEGLRWATTVCRGHKPRAALKRRGLSASVLVREPYTTAEVIVTLDGLSPRDRGVAVVHYGERNGAVGDALRAWGSRVLDVSLYEWALPEDLEPLERLVETIIDGGVDAIAFTSQVQVRHLFEVASRSGRTLKLRHALNTRTVVAAVGPTCAAALAEAGVTPRVVPSNPKMGPMVVALAEHLAARRGQLSAPLR